MAQDVLRLRQQRLVEGRAGEVAQLVLAAASTAVAQGWIVGFGALSDKGGPEMLLESVTTSHLLMATSAINYDVNYFV